jgi:hypothetical protein
MINTMTVLQAILGLGLLNVWLLRSRSATSYRGGASRNLRDEFAAYGLPTWFFYLIGILKVGTAVALLVGIWIPALVQPAAGLLVVLMLGALVMHLKIRDPMVKSLPALAMLAMSTAVLILGFS